MPKPDTAPWPAIAEAVRASGDAALNKLLDSYYMKLFSAPKTCWIAGARAYIARRLRELNAHEVRHV